LHGEIEPAKAGNRQDGIVTGSHRDVRAAAARNCPSKEGDGEREAEHSEIPPAISTITEKAGDRADRRETGDHGEWNAEPRRLGDSQDKVVWVHKSKTII